MKPRFGEIPRKKLTEAEVTAGIRATLNVLKIFHWKQWQGPMSQPKGVADILGILPKGHSKEGRMLAIEIKKEGWKPPGQGSKAYGHYLNQKRFLDRVNEDGGLGFFATSREEVIRALGAKDRFLFS